MTLKTAYCKWCFQIPCICAEEAKKMNANFWEEQNKINGKKIITRADKYTIAKGNDGIPKIKITIDWEDENGKLHGYETNLVDEAETLIGLLSGNITLGDLEP